MNIRHLDWFYAENIERGISKLSQNEARHLKVKRHYSDELVCIFDGKGKVGIGKIIDKDKIEVSEVREFPKEDSLTIAVAVPKGDRLDFMLQKLTELNVSTIILMNTKRSVVMPRETKQERLKRILIEACKQCRRAWVPELRNLTEFSSVIKEEADSKIILNQDGVKIKFGMGTTLVLVGPEGGFTEEEMKEAESNGFVKTSISKNTLRIETAAIGVAAIINSRN